MKFSAAEQQLLFFHERFSGAAFEVFGGGLTQHGMNSYAWLADDLQPGETVLDLGCGDGAFLKEIQQKGATAIGVDMSAAELEKAARFGTPLIHTRAQELPADLQVDQVRSHMAFMLMDDLETVVTALCRVLRPGGQFQAIVGRSSEPGWKKTLLQALWQYVDAEEIPCRWGDPRAADLAGWQQLFPAPDWRVLQSEDTILRSLIPIDKFLFFFRLSYYPAGLLTDQSWDALIPKLLPLIQVENGMVTWDVGIRRLRVLRTNGAITKISL